MALRDDIMRACTKRDGAMRALEAADRELMMLLDQVRDPIDEALTKRPAKAARVVRANGTKSIKPRDEALPDRPPNTQELIVRALKEAGVPVTISDLFDRVAGKTPGSVQVACSKLFVAGRISRPSPGIYAYVPE